MSDIPFPYKRDYLPTQGSIWRYEGQKVVVSHVCVMWRYESEGTYGAFKSGSLHTFTGENPSFTPLKDYGEAVLEPAASVSSARKYVERANDDLGHAAEIEELKQQLAASARREANWADQAAELRKERASVETTLYSLRQFDKEQLKWAKAQKDVLREERNAAREAETKALFERDAARVQRDGARAEASTAAHELYKMRQERDLYFKLKNQAVNALGKEQKEAERVKADLTEKLRHMMDLRDTMAKALREMEQKNRKLRIAMGNDADTSHLKAKNNQLLQQKRRWKKAAFEAQQKQLRASIMRLESPPGTYTSKVEYKRDEEPQVTKSYVDANRPSDVPLNWDTVREVNALKAKVQRLTAAVSQCSGCDW